MYKYINILSESFFKFLLHSSAGRCRWCGRAPEASTRDSWNIPARFLRRWLLFASKEEERWSQRRRRKRRRRRRRKATLHVRHCSQSVRDKKNWTQTEAKCWTTSTTNCQLNVHLRHDRQQQQQQEQQQQRLRQQQHRLRL